MEHIIRELKHSDQRGKKVHRSSFHIPITRPDVEMAFLELTDFAISLLDKGLSREELEKQFQIIFHIIGGDFIGALSCLDEKLSNRGIEIPSKKVIVNRLAAAIDNCRRIVLVEKDNTEFRKKFDYEMSRICIINSDINGFKKAINTILGHEVGDLVIDGVARVLIENETIRCYAIDHGFNFLPARAGGDEFVILIENLDGPIDESVVSGFIDVLRSVFNHNSEIGVLLNYGTKRAQKKTKELKMSIPSDFVFPFSLSFGSLGLLDAYILTERRQDFIEEREALEGAGEIDALHTHRIFSIIGTIFDLSDADCDCDKDHIRQTYLDRGDEYGFMVWRLLDSRGDAIVKENEVLQAKLTESKNYVLSLRKKHKIAAMRIAELETALKTVCDISSQTLEQGIAREHHGAFVRIQEAATC